MPKYLYLLYLGRVIIKTVLAFYVRSLYLAKIGLLEIINSKARTLIRTTSPVTIFSRL